MYIHIDTWIYMYMYVVVTYGKRTAIDFGFKKKTFCVFFTRNSEMEKIIFSIWHRQTQ